MIEKVFEMASTLADFTGMYTDEQIVGRTSDPIPDFDVDSCRQMYLSMIELAVHDYRFLLRMKGRPDSSRYDRKKLRQMTQDGDPREFFASSWFEQVCDYINVTPQLIRERLHQENAEVDLDQMTRVA